VAEEWGVDVRSVKFTLNWFAKIGLIDQENYRSGVVYIPQMLEYKDEFTRKESGSKSGAAPESVIDGPSQSQSSEVTEMERGERGKVRGESPDARRSDSNSSSHRETTHHSNVTASRNGHKTKNQPASNFLGPWHFLEIDRSRVPNEFLSGDGEEGNGFEELLLGEWEEYKTDLEEDEDYSPAAFAELVLQACQQEGIEYPKVLLKRKKELEHK
jgi:hypothetical protein